MKRNTMEVGVRRAEGRTWLESPGVGLFTEARERGAILTPGSEAGVLATLGRSIHLIVPAGVTGRIRSERPARVRHPVGHGSVLYELEDVSALARDEAAAGEHARDAGEGLVFRAPQAGRFYHRPAPGEPAFCEVGTELEEGQPIGLIEIMKTFNHVHYKAVGGLPARARVVEIFVSDASDVGQGDPLMRLEARS